MGAVNVGEITRFFTVTLFEGRPEDYTGLRRVAFRALQVTALVLSDFVADQCLLRAAALTYTSLLAFVPFFALAFAVLKGFGVQNTLEPLILEKVAAGSQDVVDKVVTYINNTNMTSLGAVGLITLVMTVVSLMGNIEAAFNAIWGVRETRPLFRKFSDYLSVLLVGPLLLLAAISVTTTLQSQKIVQWLIEWSYLGDVLLLCFKLVPYLSIWIALIFLYVFIPNIKVRISSALVGGVLAGTLWQTAQWGYIHFQVGVANYNAIYGTLALLPIFMVWIYTSWLIVLLGVEVVYAHQNQRTFFRDIRSESLSFSARERICCALLLEVAESFHGEHSPYSTEGLAEHLQLPMRTVRDLLDELHAAGFLAQTADEPPVWLPSRDLDQITVSQVTAALKGRGEQLPPGAAGKLGRLDWLFERLDGGAAAAVDLSLKQLLVASRSGGDINGE